MKTIDVDRGDTIRLFNSLAVEIGAQCNRTCVFCPVRPGDREDEFMSVPMIERIATELHNLKYSGRIAPYIYNEPMRDRRIFDIMRYLSAAVPRAVLMVSTNGDYFKSVEDIVHLFSTGVRQIVINIYSASDTQGDPARREHGRVLAERRHKQIQGWIDTIDVNQTASGYRPPPPGQRVVKIIPKYGLGVGDRKFPDFEISNRSGNIPWFRGAINQPLDRGCVRPWRVLNINWRGDAVLCCNDYKGETNFGNVATSSLVEIWNHPDLNRYRLHLQNKDRNVPLCDKCDFRGGHYPHMIERVSYSGRETL